MNHKLACRKQWEGAMAGARGLIAFIFAVLFNVCLFYRTFYVSRSDSSVNHLLSMSEGNDRPQFILNKLFLAQTDDLFLESFSLVKQVF